MVNVGADVTLCVKVQVKAALPRLVLGYMIKDRLGQQIFGTNTHHMGAPLDDMQAGDEAEFRFSFPLNLGAGSYSVTTALDQQRNPPQRQLRMARPGLRVHRDECEPQ